MLLKRILPLALSSLAGYALWQWQARSHEKRLKSVSAKPAEVTTWEGEGGALHRRGPQLGPEPVKPTTGATGAGGSPTTGGLAGAAGGAD